MPNVTLFGQKWWAEAPRRGGPYLVRIDLKTALDVDWSTLPENGGLDIEAHFRVDIGDTGVWFGARSIGELRVRGLKEAWRYEHPNAAKIERISELLAYHKRRYEEDMASIEGRGGNGLILLEGFSWNKEKGSWQTSRMQGRTRVVYTVDRHSELRVKPNTKLMCRIERTAVLHHPTADRQGFHLMVVSISHEHLNPDTEIARLEAAIAAGNP